MVVVKRVDCIIANTECQHSQNNAAGLDVSLSLQSHQSPDVRYCLHLRAVRDIDMSKS